jgi:HD-GYP domain-containing protein (c-di-GMP phosphodiesterase class II)
MDDEELPLLEENEVYNLCVQRGTLNPEERKIIEDHAEHTLRMLSQIPFPRSLRNVPEYAGSHHERVDGRGYPRGLQREQLSIPARIIAIADIFEALTAPDRPYRKGGTLSWAIDIMHRMKQDGHIDGELFDLFLSAGVYHNYSEKYLVAEQIDPVDIQRFLG